MTKFDNPLLVTKSSLPPLEKYVEKIQHVWDSSILTNNGPLHQELEANLRDYLGIENVTLFTNGHLALETAIKVLNMKGEVITTPFTFVSTTHAIVRNGLTPVFCDIKMSDYTIDEDKIESLITDKTCAIVAVHVYGHPCNVQKIQEIADRHHLHVIYDAAHAFGVKVDDTPISRFGDISMFSFHATKVFNTIEGGAAVYRNSEYASQLNLLKNFGISGPETIDLVGFNAKMNEFQAAMGLANLETLDGKIANRRAAYERTRELLSKIPGLRFVTIADSVQYNYAYLPVLIDETKFGMNRDTLFDALGERNVFPRKYFYPLLTNTTPYKSSVGEVPVAEYVSDRILCLPIFGDITLEEVEKMCTIIQEIHDGNF